MKKNEFFNFFTDLSTRDGSPQQLLIFTPSDDSEFAGNLKDMATKHKNVMIYDIRANGRVSVNVNKILDDMFDRKDGGGANIILNHIDNVNFKHSLLREIRVE